MGNKLYWGSQVDTLFFQQMLSKCLIAMPRFAMRVHAKAAKKLDISVA